VLCKARPGHCNVPFALDDDIVIYNTSADEKRIGLKSNLRWRIPQQASEYVHASTQNSVKEGDKHNMVWF
jgi:hypothetical protein